MKGYVVLDKNVVFLDGLMDFGFNGLGQPLIYSTLSQAMDKLTDDACVCEFEFTAPEEIIEAVNSAITGDNVQDTYHVKWLHSYSKKNFNA